MLIFCIARRKYYSMGNTITTANLAASQLTQAQPVDEVASREPYVHKTFEGEPPPECPMHKPKAQPQVSLLICSFSFTDY